MPWVSSSTKGVLCLMFVLFFCVCRPFSRGRTLLLTSYSCENTRLFFMPSQGRVPLIHVHCRVSLPNSLFLYAALILTQVSRIVACGPLWKSVSLPRPQGAPWYVRKEDGEKTPVSHSVLCLRDARVHTSFFFLPDALTSFQFPCGLASPEQVETPP